jgi:hypothetical protein
MNIPRLILAFLAAFIFIFFYEWLFHGIMMKGTYAESPGYLRPENELMGGLPWVALGQAIVALMVVCIFAQGFAGRGVSGGICLGLMIAVMYIGSNLIMYGVHPVSGKVTVLQSIGALVEMCLAGALIGAIYKPAGPAVVVKA